MNVSSLNNGLTSNFEIGAGGLNKTFLKEKELSALKKRFETYDGEWRESIAKEKNPKKKLMKAAMEMESLMVKMLFKNMKKNISKSDFLKGGFAEDVFDDFLTEEYAKNASKTSAFNIANQIYDQLSKYV